MFKYPKCRSQDTDLSAPPFSPPSPGEMDEGSAANDEEEQLMDVDEQDKDDVAELNDEKDEDETSTTAVQNFEPPPLAEIPLPEGKIESFS